MKKLLYFIILSVCSPIFMYSQVICNKYKIRGESLKLDSVILHYNNEYRKSSKYWPDGMNQNFSNIEIYKLTNEVGEKMFCFLINDIVSVTQLSLDGIIHFKSTSISLSSGANYSYFINEDQLNTMIGNISQKANRPIKFAFTKYGTISNDIDKKKKEEIEYFANLNSKSKNHFFLYLNEDSENDYIRFTIPVQYGKMLTKSYFKNHFFSLSKREINEIKKFMYLN